jgi:hypothetical protein
MIDNYFKISKMNESPLKSKFERVEQITSGFSNYCNARIMKKVLLVFVLITSVLTFKAQQEVLISQYMFNELFINPAVFIGLSGLILMEHL